MGWMFGGVCVSMGAALRQPRHRPARAEQSYCTEKDVLGLLLSPSEVLVLMVITAVVVFLASRKGRAR